MSRQIEIKNAVAASARVVAAIIQNTDGALLISTRPATKRFAGLWEFAGGKVEAGETQGAALVRELREELGLDLEGVVFRHLWQQEVIHQSDPNPISQQSALPANKIIIDFYHCRLPMHHAQSTAFQAQALEGQTFAWVKLDELPNYPFIPSNAELLEKLPQLLV